MRIVYFFVTLLLGSTVNAVPPRCPTPEDVQGVILMTNGKDFKSSLINKEKITELLKAADKRLKNPNPNTMKIFAENGKPPWTVEQKQYPSTGVYTCKYINSAKTIVFEFTADIQ